MIIKTVFIVLALLIAITLITRWAVSAYMPQAKSLYQGGDSLAACPDTPNCVSSTINDSHHIAAITGDEQVFKALKAAVASEERATVVSETENYLHAEFKTRLIGYIDDLELLYINGTGEVQIRSASRLGKSDFGVNRKRVKALAEKLGF